MAESAMITRDDFRFIVRILLAFIAGERPAELLAVAPTILRKLTAQGGQ